MLASLWRRPDRNEDQRLLKTKRYPIPAMIEYEYAGADTIAEVRRCFDYIKEALA